MGSKVRWLKYQYRLNKKEYLLPRADEYLHGLTVALSTLRKPLAHCLRKPGGIDCEPRFEKARTSGKSVVEFG